MPSLYGNTSSNYSVYSSSTMGLYGTTSSAIISSTVTTTNLPGLYNGLYAPLPSNVQSLLNYFDNNGSVQFSLDPITGNQTIQANVDANRFITAPNVISVFDNNGLVTFALDPLTGNSTIIATVDPAAVFSVPKARQSVSGGYGIDYSSSTGIIAIASTFTQSQLVNGTWTIVLSSTGTVTLPYYQLPAATGSYNQALFTRGDGGTYWNTVTNYSTATVDIFTSNGVQSVYTLTNMPINLSFAEISVGGVVQTQGDSYTIAGNVLSFYEAPPPGADFVQARYFTVLNAIPVPGIQGPKGDTGTFATIASTSTLGIIKVGANLAIAGDGTLSGLNSYTLPAATNAALGGVIIGAGINLDPSGTISVTTASFALNTATAYVLGGIKVGANLSITGDGTLSAVNAYTLPAATHSTLGGVIIGTGLSVDSSGTIAVTVVPAVTTATNTVLGGIKVGANLSITGDGTLSALAPYVLNTATTSVLGGVIVGNTLSIDGTGTLNYVLPTATTSTIGAVKAGANINVSSSGTISIYTAAYGVPGVIQLQSGQPFITDSLGNLNIRNGAGVTLDLSGALTLAAATSSTIGGVRIGSNINVDGTGTVSVPFATSSTLGVVRAGLNTTISSSGTLSVSSATLIGLPTATTSSLGGIYGEVDNQVILGTNAWAPNANFGIAVGSNARSTSLRSTAIGVYTSATNTGSLAIGYGAGATGLGAISIQGNGNGPYGAQSTGSFSVAINATAYGNTSTAIGSAFAYDAYAIAIGAGAAGGLNSIAIGPNAATNGYGLGQGGVIYASNNSIAIGYNAGPTSSTNTISIGNNAGQGGLYGVPGQKDGSIAIGHNAGSNGQGKGAIAIGTYAASGGQAASSIVIDATANTSSAFVYSAAGFYVKPVRNDESITTYGVYYNPSSQELTYANTNAKVKGFINTNTYITMSGADGGLQLGWTMVYNPSTTRFIAYALLKTLTTTSTYQVISNGVAVTTSTVTIYTTPTNFYVGSQPNANLGPAIQSLGAGPVKLWNRTSGDIYEIEMITTQNTATWYLNQPAFLSIEKII